MARIHVFGASGSGTTTLGADLAAALGCVHLDTDDYFWIQTDPPFREIREAGERLRLLMEALDSSPAWTLSGTLAGWGDPVADRFDLAVYLYVPGETRMARLRARERERYGPEIFDPADPRHEIHRGFLEWAAAYDSAGPEQRSRVKHEQWMAGLACPVLRIEGEPGREESLAIVLERLRELGRAAP